MKAYSSIATRFVAPLALILLIGFGWQWVATNMVSVLPTLQDMWASVRDDPRMYTENAWITVKTALFGFLLGGVIALALGIMCVNKAIRSAVMPIATMLHVTPIVAVAPALIVAFGFGDGPHLATATIAAFFPMLINAITGFQAIDDQAHEVFCAMSASRAEVFWRLRLLSSLPYLFAGARVSITGAMVGAVVSEFFGTPEGLGALIVTAQANINLPVMWCAILVTAISSMLLMSLVGLVERLTVRW
ncbi:ABC transporter permease [Nocardioides sp. zg-536]|uniref:ABC transporter permease n=1 Tax=Nocardioides faecalis TaxID=2803858 RepID=A0A938Y8V4_9ACTN|nr:ABC transporter permease [Nocardioides faecalis]MBM9459990.1 ABC transporter permease [Nocardioides faecalis]MBS4753142.1 ABC transporter permease [Nocardioides faecalis]QVI58789.1 ABC transporter permease [Nocardioides faecalis]